MARIRRLESSTCVAPILLIALGGPLAAFFVLVPAALILGPVTQAWTSFGLLTIVAFQLLLAAFVGYRAADLDVTLTGSVTVALIPALVVATVAFPLMLSAFV